MSGIGAEAAQLGPGGGAPGAHLQAAARKNVQHRGALGDLDGVIELGHADDDAVPHPDLLRDHGARGEEELGRGAVGILLEEVVLHRPHLVEAQLVGQLHLLQRVVVDGALRLPRPRAGHRQLVEEAELHCVSSWYRVPLPSANRGPLVNVAPADRPRPAAAVPRALTGPDAAGTLGALSVPCSRGEVMAPAPKDDLALEVEALRKALEQERARSDGLAAKLAEALEQQTATAEILRDHQQLADRHPAGTRRRGGQRRPPLRSPGSRPRRLTRRNPRKYDGIGNTVVEDQSVPPNHSLVSIRPCKLSGSASLMARCQDCGIIRRIRRGTTASEFEPFRIR